MNFTINISVEIATLTREDNKTKMTILASDEVEKLIKKHEEEEAKTEKAKSSWLISPLL